MWQDLILLVTGKKKLKASISKPVYIYAIRPINRKGYLYCGQTCQEPEARIYAHLNDAVKGKHKNPKLQAALMRFRFWITFDILEVTSEGKADERESYWIKKLMSEGHQLTNIRDPKNRFQNLKKGKVK